MGQTGLQARGELGTVHPVGQFVATSLPLVSEEHRPLIVVVGVVAMVPLLLAVAIGNAAFSLVAAIVAMMVIALICGLLFVLTRGGARSQSLRRAADAISGDWWQLVFDKNDEGHVVADALTWLTVRMKPDAVYVSGTLYGPDGRPKASWETDAVAITQLDPVAFFYRWKGQTFREREFLLDSGVLSGIGEFAFDSDEDGRSLSGGGWYGAGSVERLTFGGGRREVRLIRIEDRVRAKLKPESAEFQNLIAEQFRELARRYSPS